MPQIAILLSVALSSIAQQSADGSGFGVSLSMISASDDGEFTLNVIVSANGRTVCYYNPFQISDAPAVCHILAFDSQSELIECLEINRAIPLGSRFVKARLAARVGAIVKVRPPKGAAFLRVVLLSSINDGKPVPSLPSGSLSKDSYRHRFGERIVSESQRLNLHKGGDDHSVSQGSIPPVSVLVQTDRRDVRAGETINVSLTILNQSTELIAIPRWIGSAVEGGRTPKLLLQSLDDSKASVDLFNASPFGNQKCRTAVAIPPMSSIEFTYSFVAGTRERIGYMPTKALVGSFKLEVHDVSCFAVGDDAISIKLKDSVFPWSVQNKLPHVEVKISDPVDLTIRSNKSD
jgi:hypothetical protein